MWFVVAFFDAVLCSQLICKCHAHMLSFRFIPQEFLCAINIGIDKFVCHAMDLNFTAGRREVHDRVSPILINKKC